MLYLYRTEDLLSDFLLELFSNLSILEVFLALFYKFPTLFLCFEFPDSMLRLLEDFIYLGVYKSARSSFYTLSFGWIVYCKGSSSFSFDSDSLKFNDLLSFYLLSSLTSFFFFVKYFERFPVAFFFSLLGDSYYLV